MRPRCAASASESDLKFSDNLTRGRYHPLRSTTLGCPAPAIIGAWAGAGPARERVMDDLVFAVLMTAALPGLILGLWAGIRSGLLWMLFGGIFGLIGGVVGGFALPGFMNYLGIALPDGPITVIIGSLVGALIVLLLTSGLRRA